MPGKHPQSRQGGGAPPTVARPHEPARHRWPRRPDGHDSVEQLIARFRRTGDRRLRDRAVQQYMPLAQRLAAKYHRGSEPHEDLLQVAYLGLVKAVDGFDPHHGTRFASYAIPTISGELRRHFRDTTWTLHVPRGVQEAALDVRRATDEAAVRLGRAPTVRELADRTGLRVEEVVEALHAHSVQRTASLDQPLPGDEEGGATVGERLGEEDARLDLVDHRVTVAPLIDALPEREREILFLRFARDMTQTEIAQRIGCSQMQISRLLRRAINRLSQVEAHAERLPQGASSR